MEYKITIDDLQECFEFAIKYHLDPRKVGISRTSGQARGLGEIIDNFLAGKLVELGVAKMIEEIASDKEVVLDFDIKQTNQVKDEPDITHIVEKSGSSEKKREPELFIEIKRTSPVDRWVGLTEEQFSTMKSQKYTNDKIFIIGASIKTPDGIKNPKTTDLLGCYFKKKTDLRFSDQFADIESVPILIGLEYIISGKELEEHGRPFSKNDLIYETEIFPQATNFTAKQVRKETNKINKVGEINNGELKPYAPVDKISDSSGESIDFVIPKEFFPMLVTGKLSLYEKINKCSRRMYVDCLSDVVVKSDFLGRFKLTKGNVYEYNVNTLGLNPVLKRNNIWVAKRNMENIISDTPDSLIKKIAKNI
ncbi:hypothetical protein K8R32_03820 [bacterium]|nr:hypothetical protein [bacterium]